MSLDDKYDALEKVWRELKSDPAGEFARVAFLKILEVLPSAPNLPSAAIFNELGKKVVPYFIDIALIRHGSVYMSHRDDHPYRGWHFPGSMRTPRQPKLEDIRGKAKREFGETVKIKRVIKDICTFDQEDCPRFHHAVKLVQVEFTGEPITGKWFSEMPADILPIHERYWPHVAQLLK